MAPPQKNLEISSFPNYNFLHHATQSLSKNLSLNYLMQVTMLYQQSNLYIWQFLNGGLMAVKIRSYLPINFNFDQVLTEIDAK
jgi:hypothetical protein